MIYKSYGIEKCELQLVLLLQVPKLFVRRSCLLNLKNEYTRNELIV